MWIIQVMERDGEGHPYWVDTHWHHAQPFRPGDSYNARSVASAVRFIQHELTARFPDESFRISHRGEGE